MRKVRQETVMTGHAFLLKLTSLVTINSHSDKNYGERRFFKKRRDSDALLPFLKSTSEQGLKK